MEYNDLINRIASLFSNTYLLPISIDEDYKELKAKYSLEIDKFPTQQEFDSILSELCKRDYLHLSVKQDGEIVETFLSNKPEVSFSEFLSVLQRNGVKVHQEIELQLTIVKKIENRICSIYYVEKLAEYLNNLSLSNFLSIYDKNIVGKIDVLEYQGNVRIDELHTASLFIGNKPAKHIISDLPFRNERNKLARTLCHWDISTRGNVLPDDFYPLCNSTSPLLEIYKKIALIYSCIYIFDYTHLTNDLLLYKLNGYKTFGEDINTQTIGGINIDISSYDIFYEIYSWIYDGGNTYDKMNIAKNIISLNFEPKTLNLSKRTFEAIQSNYKIYERENVKQYIGVRNKLSELLLELQSKIGEIVQGYIDDFKKSLITLVSFFISVIVIQVVSNGEWLSGFTKEIVLLSTAFLVISLLFFFYSRWEFKKKKEMFEKHYEQIKNRYKDLLTEHELNEIFDQCNPQLNNGSKYFPKRQACLFSWVWIGSILILGVALLWISKINQLL